MSQKTAVNAWPKGAPQMVGRLDLAKAHLVKFLEELVARNQQKEEIHVGMRFFAHRVARELGADNVPTGVIRLQDEYLQNLAKLLNKPELA